MAPYLDGKIPEKEKNEILETVYLTYSFVPLATCTDLGVGDVETPSVLLSALFITDYGQIDNLQHVIMAAT